MKAVQLYGYGGIDCLRYEDVPEPEPGDHQILVKVLAGSVNPVDWKIREGHLRQRMPIQFPAILGRDAAGEVAALGAGVTRFQVGQKVLGLVNRAYAEYVADQETSFALMPEDLDPVQAGVLPLVTITGAQLIERGVDPKKGQRILVTGALGGVGRSAVFVARQHGACVIAGVRASQKSEAESLAADQVVALDDESEMAALADLDSIADTLGGDIAVRLSVKLKKNGVFASVVGKPEGVENAVQVWAQADGGRLRQLACHVAKGSLKIPIGRRFTLAQAGAAQEAAEKGAGGKVALVP